MATGQDPQGGRRGWNGGVGGKLRTTFSSFSSFSSSAKVAPPQAPSRSALENRQPTKTQPPKTQHPKGVEIANEPAASLPDPVEAAGDDSQGARATVATVSKGPGNGARLVFQKQGHEWALPPLTDSESSITDAGSWLTRFCKWCGAFITLNETCSFSDADRALMVEAYAHWTDSTQCLTRKQRRAAKSAALQTKKQGNFRQLVMTARNGPGGLNPSGPRAEGDPKPNGSAASLLQDVGMGTPVANLPAGQIPRAYGPGEEGVAHMQRYFPGISGDAIFCVLCASSGHRQDSCPSAICRFCQTLDHPSYSCPTRRRCSKCKQLGHIADDCREKLALAPGEGVECAFCQAQDHTEVDCVEFKRTYWPDENNIRKIKDIPVYCYCCGAKGHYGTQCGLNPGASRPALHETWSRTNSQKYVDQNSSEFAIIWDAASGAVSNGRAADEGPPTFGGKGIARRTHIIFEDDDDDDDGGFIRPPVQKPPPPGKIKFQATNRGGPPQKVNGHQGGGKHLRNGGGPPKAPVNPPLPPGPPPPLPPQASQNMPKPLQSRKRKQKARDNNPQNHQQPRKAKGQGQEPPGRSRDRYSRDGGKRGKA